MWASAALVPSAQSTPAAKRYVFVAKRYFFMECPSDFELADYSA